MPEPYIEIQNAEGRRNVPVNDQPITIGRHSTNVIVLAEGNASRYHCVIEKAPEGGLRVRDLDSSNGTKVNGQLVKTMRIGDGDTITVGKTSLRLIAPSLAPVGAGAGGKGRGVQDAKKVVDVVVDFDDEEEEEVTAADYERVLLRTVESLPDKKLNDADIALINARGSVAHAARDGNEKPGKKRGGGDEPRE